jgi:hypothetical protein
MTYYLLMRDDGGAEETVELDTDDLDVIEQECRDWAEGGDWGDDGASVSVYWRLTDEDGEEINTCGVTVEIEPNHDALIRAGGDIRCDHEWTREGEGGCDENPGVWSTGGTSMMFRSHCVHCGLIRTEHITGSQRNPGEHDTVTYELPDGPPENNTCSDPDGHWWGDNDVCKWCGERA